MSRHWLQHNNRLLGTSSSNTSNTTSVPRVTQTIPTDTNAELEEVLPNDAGVVTKVNEAIVDQAVGRLFAVIQVAGKQYKITTDDIVVVEGFFVPEVGDRIRLEKVLLAGSKDFTLVGRPLLDREVVKVEGTVIEKTLAVPKVRFHYIRRKGHRKFKLLQIPQTMILINSIEVSPLEEGKK
ncbi:large ribosomal subunit protein bL21m-like [Liolophura sinensis]|uniref:large ribosomal subunit protein bL21m-like n=1 Tax=Liolophura sinensis TaxID=3198878 RepID=UPI0031585073